MKNVDKRLSLLYSLLRTGLYGVECSKSTAVRVGFETIPQQILVTSNSRNSQMMSPNLPTTSFFLATQVYKFLRAWLQYKDDMEAAAAAPASTTTPGTDETPGSAALDNQGQLNSQTVQGSPSDKPRVAPAGSQPDAQPVSPGPRSDPVLNPGSDPKGSFTAPVNQGTPTKQPSPPVRPLGAEAAEAAAVPGKRVAGAPTDILYGGRPRAPPGTKLIPYESPPTSTGLDQVLANPPGDPLTKWLIALVPVVLAVEGYRLVSWL